MYPFVSIIIPCRNEEKYILACLESLAEDQIKSYPKDRLEILVINGKSEDDTEKIVQEYIRQHSDINIKIIENENKFTPFGLNIGIDKAQGDIIAKTDAHTQYPEGYIKLSVHYLTVGFKGENVDGVGGIIITPSLKDIA